MLYYESSTTAILASSYYPFHFLKVLIWALDPYFFVRDPYKLYGYCGAHTVTGPPRGSVLLIDEPNDFRLGRADFPQSFGNSTNTTVVSLI